MSGCLKVISHELEFQAVIRLQGFMEKIDGIKCLSF